MNPRSPFQSRKQIYGERLWPSPNETISYGEAFERSLAGLAPDRMALVNLRVDQLAVYLKTGHNPPSLDFKKLKVSSGRSTYEMDAWSDQDAKRLFGYFIGAVFVLDRLGPHL